MRHDDRKALMTQSMINGRGDIKTLITVWLESFRGCDGWEGRHYEAMASSISPRHERRVRNALDIIADCENGEISDGVHRRVLSWLSWLPVDYYANIEIVAPVVRALLDGEGLRDAMSAGLLVLLDYDCGRIDCGSVDGLVRQWFGGGQ